MNRQAIEEQLSAMLDGEASDLELRRVLQQLDECTDAERQALYAQWNRFNMARQHLQQEEAGAIASARFTQSVTAAIAELEPDTFSAGAGAGMANESAAGSVALQQVNTPAWSKFAVAASVALAVIAVFQQNQISTQRADLQTALAAQAQTPQIEQPSFPSQALPASQYAGFGANPSKGLEQDNADQLKERRRMVDQFLLQYARSPEFQGGLEHCEVRCAKP